MEPLREALAGNADPVVNANPDVPANPSDEANVVLQRPPTALAWGGRALLRHYGQHVGRNLEVEGDVSRSNARKRVQAAAEFVAREQVSCGEKVLEIIAKMKESDLWRPHSFVERKLHDETPLELLVEYGHGGLDKQTSKCFAVEIEWSMLIELLPTVPLLGEMPSGDVGRAGA